MSESNFTTSTGVVAVTAVATAAAVYAASKYYPTENKNNDSSDEMEEEVVPMDVSMDDPSVDVVDVVEVPPVLPEVVEVVEVEKEEVVGEEVLEGKELSEKTKKALATATMEGDTKTVTWIRISAFKGWEGAGFIPFIFADGKIEYILGINKKKEAEYPGGKTKMKDGSKKETVKRETEEEIGLKLPLERFNDGFEVNGGTTGYPSYVYLVEITEEEFSRLKSKDKTFTSFIRVDSIFDCDTVTDKLTGKQYEVRKFNKKYVLPQVKEAVLDFVTSKINTFFAQKYGKDVEMVMTQTECDKKKAIESLIRSNGDVVSAIMDLTQ
jgi:hypothetical protein